jgi:hypothetical protein
MKLHPSFQANVIFLIIARVLLSCSASSLPEKPGLMQQILLLSSALIMYKSVRFADIYKLFDVNFHLLLIMNKMTNLKHSSFN